MFLINSYRYVGAAPLVADVSLDFVNGVYRKDGVTASLASLGITNTGVITPGSGINYSGTQNSNFTYQITGDYMVVYKYTGTNATAWYWTVMGAAGEEFEALRNGTNDLVRSNVGGSVAGAATMYSRAATGKVGSNIRVSFDGNAVQSAAATFPNISSTAAWIIGNRVGDDRPLGGFLQSFAIYKASLSDAQIQALAA